MILYIASGWCSVVMTRAWKIQQSMGFKNHGRISSGMTLKH